MTAAEAEALIATRDRTGRLLVVAFPGSLSPQVRTAAAMIADGEVGPILNIDAVVWQDWHVQRRRARGARIPDLSGGGFLFDTGAHMLNTVTDLAGEDVTQVAAWLEDDGSPVDIRGVVMARLASGALVTMNACGRAIPSSTVGHPGVLRGGDVPDRDLGRAPGAPAPRRGPRSRRSRRSPVAHGLGAVPRRPAPGVEPNPSPPEVGLRMARLWDAIRASSASGRRRRRSGHAASRRAARSRVTVAR